MRAGLGGLSWLEVLLSKAAGQMDAISLHYYVFAGDGIKKATQLTSRKSSGSKF